MRRWIVWGCVLAGAAIALLASLRAFADSTAEDAVIAVEHARTNALIQGNLAMLDRIEGSDVTYTHASGKRDTKDTYLDAIRSGTLKYVSWQPIEMHARIYGNTAVLNGVYAIQAYDHRVTTDLINIKAIFLTIYVKRDGRWQQVAWQTTKIPDAPSGN